MTTLLFAGLLLILVFSFAVSTYISLFKLRLQNLIPRAFAILGIGAGTAVATFVLCVSIIWPPVM